MPNQKPMPNIRFHIMAAIMKTRGISRNKKKEVQKAGIRPGDTVLDYGCGLGFSTIPAAQFTGKKGKVYALDIHPLAIRTVNKKAAKKGLKNIQTILSSHDTGLPDNSIDITLLYNVLPMIKDCSALIREMHRILKKGATLCIQSGFMSTLYSKNTTENDLIKLMKDNGPLELKTKTGKFYIFQKPA